MSRIIQHFGKQCSNHLQGECVVVGHFCKPYIGQAVGGKLDLMVLIGGAEEWVTIQWEKSRSYTLNSSCENLRIQIEFVICDIKHNLC
jgi:hypothetical protein